MSTQNQPDPEEDRRNMLWAAIIGWTAIVLMVVGIIIYLLILLACADGRCTIGS